MADGELSALFASMVRARRVPGAQFALFRNGRRAGAAAGEAEYGSGRRVTGDLAFPIGSIGKAFTATVAMILVADGDLELDEPIGQYVPECPAAATLTLRQLLSHTSGLESGPDGGPSMRRYVSGLQLIQPPGRAFSYSNAGFVLVGRLIEEVTGMSWWAAMESVLLRPLGIVPAFVVGPGDPDAATTRPIAAGHAVGADGRTRPVSQNLTIAEAPAGAIAASATDLVTFGLAHLDIGASVLPAEFAAQMRRPEPAADAFGLADRWGLGLALFDEWAGHDGTADGTWCQLRIDPVNKVVVALTSNASTGASLWTDLVAELAGQGLTVASGALMDVPETSVPPPESCFGRYRNGDLEYSIIPGPDGITLAVDDDPQALITFHEGLTFSMRDILTGQSMYAGRCLADRDSGRIDRIQINGRLAARC
ncbi:serine hydrolase domain-containing protein [Actinocrispum sp. NPDC049592]|uniref:serine hydrolase domain-containing protein n=1 Tax=Actinocrispum sp. NPDC049592 TaxID=3154835 RepID=UPI0034382260